jgi:DNA polymerase-3 subunit alpha
MLYVIHKIAIWCKDVKNNIALGPGRGSCVGSLIVYLLHITNLDPLEHGLLFERFINLERLSMPDIDIDICKEHRNDVLKQIGIMFKDENNEQNVIQIIIFLKFIFKMMIKDLLRVSNSNLKFMEINKILKIHDNKIALQEFLHEVECLYTSLIKLLQYTNLQNDIIREVFLYGISYRLYKLVNPYLIYKTHILQLLNINDEAKLFDVARFINNKFYELTQIMKNVDTYSNCIKTTGIHAAGILVGNKNFLSFIPLYFGSNATNDAVLCTHYDIEMLTDINAVKFDILGLGNLTIISSLTKILGIKFNEENIFNIMLTKNDISSRVYSMVKYGAVKNIFQIDKFHLISLCNRMKLEKFSDIVALNALNRPGTNQLAYSYISNKNKNSIFIENNVGTHVYKYTKESFGVIIYQEQIIQIAQSMANYTASQADVFRAIISKKKKNLLEIEKEKFITNCINNNVDMKDITKFYKTMEAFSGYAFNKSHSAAYSKITITTMFLKYAYYMQYNLLCIMHKYKNVQKIIEIMVECTLFTNIWYKLSNIYDSKYNTYSTNDNSKYVSFDDMQCCSMIRATIPSFIIKGISIQDLHILHTTNYKDIFNVIFNSQVSKSKLEILNLFNFFERVLNINKLYKQIDNLKQLTSNFKNTLYGFSNMNMNDNDYTESNFSLIYQDQQYINHVGFSLIRANIAFIIKKIFNNIAFQSNKFYTYIIYKIYEKQHSIMNYLMLENITALF